MNEILIGEEAQKFCKELLNSESANFYLNQKKGNQKRGYFPDVTSRSNKTVYVAFDNRTNDCWVEQFDTAELAVSWLNDEFEMDDLPVFKRNRKN